VQRREHEVARQAGLDRDLGGLEIADFADHDHVGILPQDRAQPAREGHFHLGVDLGLADAVDVVLDGSSTVITLRVLSLIRSSAA